MGVRQPAGNIASGSKTNETKGHTMTTTYTTTGSVRGSCGHKHRSIGAAVRCLLADQSGCTASRGYSDRTVRVIDADGERTLTREEHDEHEFYATR